MKITREQTETPKNAKNWDWRKEVWADDSKVRSVAYQMAVHALAVMSVEGDDDQNQQDSQVHLALHPELTDQLFKSRVLNDVIHARLLAAVGIGFDEIITQWMKRFGDISHNGPATRNFS